MKRIFLILFSIFSSVLFSLAQDTIITKSGSDILVKIEEIGLTEIRYKKFDNLEGPLHVILKSDVSMIRYKNGIKDVFADENINDYAPAVVSSKTDLYLKGQSDAVKYYKGYKEAGIVTLITGLILPVLVIIPAIIISSTPPQEIDLNFPDPKLMKHQDYYMGYTFRAKKIKSRKVWTNFGIALGCYGVAFIIVYSQQG